MKFIVKPKKPSKGIPCPWDGCRLVKGCAMLSPRAQRKAANNSQRPSC